MPGPTGRLDGRVAIVTGAGGGLGREHALALASHGAAVVVNDLGASLDGAGRDRSAAQMVVAEIERLGGRAVASGHDVADWREAEQLIQLAVSSFGDLHVLVNNAGIIRDRLLANMSEVDWDDVVRVHLKGHAAPSRHAAAYWRAQSKLGHEVHASIVHTSSASAFIGNFGQANYSAAKMGIIGLSHVLSTEYARIGVRSNVVSPMAWTRMTTGSAVSSQGEASSDDRAARLMDPANVSPVVAWLAQRDCPADRQVLHVYGGRCVVLQVPAVHLDLRSSSDRWTLDEFDQALGTSALAPAFSVEQIFAEDGMTAEVTAPAPGR